MVEVKPINISLDQHSPVLCKESQLCHENEFRGIHLPLTYPFTTWNVIIDGLCIAPEGSLSLGSGSEGKKREIVFLNRRPRTLQRGKYLDAFNQKINLLKDVLYACETQCFPVRNLPDVEEVPSHDGETV
ncbi:hypothetical protein TNCV_797661 [Trichonephila clavipes]|nr:hypothetical protein TNCV_797661 [Trichonephila clavipes]